MLLRRSGEKSEESYNLVGVLDGERVGVEDEAILLKIAEAVYQGDSADLAEVRSEALPVLGVEKLVDAIGIASGFNGITKVANATGIPLDSKTEEVTAVLRAQTGIDEYSDAQKSKAYNTDG